MSPVSPTVSLRCVVPTISVAGIPPMRATAKPATSKATNGSNSTFMISQSSKAIPSAATVISPAVSC